MSEDFIEEDPVFSSSPAANITINDVNLLRVIPDVFKEIKTKLNNNQPFINIPGVIISAEPVP